MDQCPHHDYPPMPYTNGELKALLGPIFGLNAENIKSAVVTVVSDKDMIGTHSMRDPKFTSVQTGMHDMNILAHAIINIILCLQEEEESGEGTQTSHD